MTCVLKFNVQLKKSETNEYCSQKRSILKWVSFEQLINHDVQLGVREIDDRPRQVLRGRSAKKVFD